jgi:integrase/recombinase XerD
MEELFKAFLKEKQYLKNCSNDTLAYFGYCFKALSKYANQPTEGNLRGWVIAMREAGQSVGTINSYARGINSFLSWLHENGHTPTHLKIKPLKQEQRVMRTLSDDDVVKILRWKPASFTDCRLHALLCTLLDTGSRIEELLTLKRCDVDMDNLIIKVYGKGSKERIVPMSLELRKILYKFLQSHHDSLAFPSRSGGRLLYENTRRSFMRLCKKLDIKDFDGSFHTFRRKFARNYVKNGGNLFYLQKAMGHSKLDTTRKYVEVSTDDLKRVHAETSILSRIRH